MPSNYDLVVKKLGEVGAEFIESLNNGNDEFEPDLHIELWNVHGRGLVVAAHDNGLCGLYQFVGIEGDPVEKDLEFIENFSTYNKQLESLKKSLQKTTIFEETLVVGGSNA